MGSKIGLLAAAVLVGALFTVGVASPVFASGGNHTVSTTENVHGSFTEPDATNPCTGAPGVASFDGNAVFHLTYFTGGDEYWFTFTETGKVSVTWDGVTYTGHATAWGNGNWNEQNQNSTFTLTIRV